MTSVPSAPASRATRTPAWRHREAREGFEIAFVTTDTSGIRLAGHTTAVEAGRAWSVRYDIELDPRWHTRRAHVSALSSAGEQAVTIETDGSGRWQVDGVARPELDGCLDVDLESSACTNTIPVHRLRLDVGEGAEAPAAYVRAVELAVERLEQRYMRVDDDAGHQRYDYRAPAFGVECRLVYDTSGLVLDYPGLARRVQ